MPRPSTRPPARQGAAAQAATQRSHEITRIQVLRRQAGLGDDEYHDLVGNLFDGVRSSTALDAAQRRRLIAHLVRLQSGRQGPAAAPAKAAALPPLRPRQKKMFSLWQQLADGGRVRERGMAALQAWVARQTGVDRWEWLNSHQEDTVIESLKRWLQRPAGVAAADVDVPVQAQGAAPRA